MKTTQEMFESLQLQLSELIVLLKPKEIDDTDKELHDKLDAILEKQKEKPSLVFDDTKKEEIEDFDYDSDADVKFTRQRNWFAVALAIITAFASWLAWLNWLSMFPTIFGFFFTAGGLLFVLAFDHYVLPGNTLKRISKNGIASALVILVFAILYIGGVSVGNSLITNRERGEEYSAPAPTRTERTVEQPAAEPRQQFDTTATDKEN